MRLLKMIILLIALIANIQVARAGINLSGTRVVYSEGNKEVAVAVNNTNKNDEGNGVGNFLIQPWLERWQAGDETGSPSGSPVKDKSTFIVTPTLFTLKPGESNNLRITAVNTQSLPKDRESVFWLNVLAIPATPKNNNGNTFQINVNTCIKLIYRPSSLSAKDAAAAYQQVKVSREGRDILLANPTAFYISISKLTVGSKKIEYPVTLAPGGTVRIKNTTPGTISWNALDDYGAITSTVSR
ncbi:molecular chaperone [Pantoea endophytica]